VQALIAAGADVNALIAADRASINNGWTPLMFACYFDRLDVVQTLIDAGADVHARSDGGRTVLMHCTQLEIVQCLITAGTNVNAHCDHGWTALLCACDRGQLDIVQYLIAAGADVTARLRWGYTALDVVFKRFRWNYENNVSIAAVLRQHMRWVGTRGAYMRALWCVWCERGGDDVDNEARNTSMALFGAGETRHCLFSEYGGMVALFL